jgi:hypothetical protein
MLTYKLNPYLLMILLQINHHLQILNIQLENKCLENNIRYLYNHFYVIRFA